jgi:hypothetical protein
LLFASGAYDTNTEYVPALAGVAIDPDGYVLSPDTGTVVVLPTCVPVHPPPGNNAKFTDPPGEYPPPIFAESEIDDPTVTEPPPDPDNDGDAGVIVTGSPLLLLATGGLTMFPL